MERQVIKMKDLAETQSYLTSMSYEESHFTERDLNDGVRPFVTISRETGAGGHALANELMDLMAQHPNRDLFDGWHVFDQELCEIVANDPSLNVSLKSLLSEEYHSMIADILEELFIGKSPQDLVMRKMFQTIRSLATVGKVILVGRASACVTRELKLGTHVRLIAPYSKRVKRMCELMDLDESAAKLTVLEQDRSREKLAKIFFNKEIQEPLLYDSVWNTSTVPIREIAKAMLSIIEQRAGLARSVT